MSEFGSRGYFYSDGVADAHQSFDVQTILDVTLGGEPFAIGYHSPQLHWFFLDSEADTTVHTEVSFLLFKTNLCLAHCPCHSC